MVSKEELLQDLHRFVDNEGRLPEYKELKVSNGYYDINRYVRNFGSMNNALEIAGLKIKINENLFNLNNLNLKTLYMIGYIIGDGCISSREDELSISCAAQDKEHLNKLYNYLNLDTKIQYKKGYVGNKQDSYTLRKNCKQWKDDLSLYGIVPRKSLISYIPLYYLKTSEEEAAICLGLLDADGCITYSKSKYKISPRVGIVGSEQLCEDFKYLLIKNNINTKSNVRKGSGNVYQFEINGINICKKFNDFIYQSNELEELRMDRKYNKLQDLINNH